ncbi:hypothetical protein DB346_01885 [Verrucomicrobia bacterium LW23]|nr:hypothetical protein DB346_01885 [Verrucomicrobia bacterium LW23]
MLLQKLTRLCCAGGLCRDGRGITNNIYRVTAISTAITHRETMVSRGGIWSALGVIASLIAMALLTAIVVMAFLPVIQEMQDRKNTLLASEQKLAEAREEERRLAREIELIKSNPAYVEHLARQKLNMGKPGEVIYFFEPYKTASNAPAVTGRAGTGLPDSAGSPPAATAAPPPEAGAPSQPGGAIRGPTLRSP